MVLVSGERAFQIGSVSSAQVLRQEEQAVEVRSSDGEREERLRGEVRLRLPLPVR